MDRNRRLEDTGVADINNPILGETYVDLSEHFVKEGPQSVLKKWNDLR